MKIARSAATATLALTAALALAACTPPHENDSDQSFQDNQSGVSSHSAENTSSEEPSCNPDRFYRWAILRRARRGTTICYP